MLLEICGFTAKPIGPSANFVWKLKLKSNQGYRTIHVTEQFTSQNRSCVYSLLRNNMPVYFQTRDSLAISFSVGTALRLTCQPVTPQTVRAKQGPGGPLIEHKLDTAWQGRLHHSDIPKNMHLFMIESYQNICYPTDYLRDIKHIFVIWFHCHSYKKLQPAGFWLNIKSEG